MKILDPSGWKSPKGYSNGIVAQGKLIFLAGQIGWNENQEFQSEDLVPQVDQALRNIVKLLEEAGSEPSHMTRMVWYVKDKQEYLSQAGKIGEVYRKHLGKHYPAMTLVQVADLLESKAKVEIEVTAVIPEL